MKSACTCICVLVLVLACRSGQAATPSLAPADVALSPTAVTPTTSPPVPLTPVATSRPVPTGEPSITVDCAVRLAEGRVAFGTNGWWTDQDAEMWRIRYEELSPRVVRLPLVHQLLEPVNDDNDPNHIHWGGFWFDEPIPWFERTITYQQWFETLRELDVTLMLHVPHVASWLSANGDAGLYSTYPPHTVEEYGEFVRATLIFLVNEVGYPPERIILDPINEPDLRCGQDPAVPCFWNSWTMDDLVAVLEIAHQAADAVDPAIRLVGLSTCCGDKLVEELMQEHDGAELLDGITYHHYERGFDQSRPVERGQNLAAWALPVYVNEYGSPKYWSNGVEGALWHAAALAQFWSAGIAPVQFAMSEFPGMHEGYNQLGLLTDWRSDWEPKPAYAVYVGFAHHLGPTVPISTTAEPPLVVAAGQHGEKTAVWVVNASHEKRPDVVLQIERCGSTLPSPAAEVGVYDILTGNRQADRFVVAGVPSVFAYDLPAYSILVFTLETSG